MNATISQWLDSALAHDIATALAHSLWQGGAVALVLAVLLRAIPGRFSTLRYWTSCGALLAIIIASAVTFIVLRGQHVSHATRHANPAPALQDPAPLPDTNLAAQPASASLSLPFHHIVAIWILGVAFFSIWHICGWAWLVRIRRGDDLARWSPVIQRLSRQLNVSRRVRLIESVRVDGPWVVGLLKPVILVPLGLLNDLSPRQVEAILAHELAHVRRNDYLVNLLQAAVETLLFYHPAVWWISRQIRRERENCCDDLAASICGSATVYVESLLAIEQRRASMGSGLALAAAGGQLAARAQRLLSPRRSPLRRGNRVRSLTVAGLALACIVAAILFATAPTRAADPTTAPQTHNWYLDTNIADESLKQNLSVIKPEDLVAEQEDYKISPNDLLTISITDLVGPGVETVKSIRVSEKGNITMPVLKNPIKVAGISDQEAEKAIAKAYRDENLLANAQISVTVAEARGRSFSVLGQIERPGQYQITQADFRVLDALTVSGAKPADMSELYVIRGKDKNARVIPIAVQKLTAGDLSQNIVIRPNDMLMASAPERKFLRVTVTGPDQISVAGKSISWAELDQNITAIPAAQRKHVVLELAVGKPDMPVSEYFEVQGKLINRVKDYGMDYFSNVGIDRAAATKPAASRDVIYDSSGKALNFSAATQPAAGILDVQTGTLSLVGDNTYTGPTTQPADGAVHLQSGTLTVVGDTQITGRLTTQPSESGNLVLNGSTLQFSGTTQPVRDSDGNLTITGGTLVISNANTAGLTVATTAPAGAATQPSARSYYIRGVPRAGMYSLPAGALTLKQAIAAAGGFPDDNRNYVISVTKRTGTVENTEEQAVSSQEFKDGKFRDAQILDGDIVDIRKLEAAATAPAGSIHPSPIKVDPRSAKPAGGKADDAGRPLMSLKLGEKPTWKTLQEFITSAGHDFDNSDQKQFFIDVIRSDGARERRRIADNKPVDPTTGKVDDVTLKANDKLLVREKDLTGKAQEPAPPASPAKP